MKIDRLNPPTETEMYIGFKLSSKKDWLTIKVDSSETYMTGYDRVHKLKVPIPPELFELRIEEVLEAGLGVEMEIELVVKEKVDNPPNDR